MQGTVARAFDVHRRLQRARGDAEQSAHRRRRRRPAGDALLAVGQPGQYRPGGLLALRTERRRSTSFASYSYMESQPDDGDDPVRRPVLRSLRDAGERSTGWMIYAGARYNLPNDKTKVGVEFNHGSRSTGSTSRRPPTTSSRPKTTTRGNVYEAYVTHRIAQEVHREARPHQLRLRLLGFGLARRRAEAARTRRRSSASRPTAGPTSCRSSFMARF